MAVGQPSINGRFGALIKLPLGFDKLAIGASFDKLAIGAGLYQNRGRPAVDKLLMRRNSGSGLRGLDLRVRPSGWSWPC